ncbi:hypothetical protein CYMTET_22008 [Cymbomonas tetramitiformis]|uniref:Uncharacterized protein n=1 Tax=Cymbomonas tetramitiformis TaxID=36881 RepID=A0AAE0L2F0_9CHLO|nr:hypothetical protein CYMTET_22008 [Cymbomonas tetramitiformis]
MIPVKAFAHQPRAHLPSESRHVPSPRGGKIITTRTFAAARPSKIYVGRREDEVEQPIDLEEHCAILEEFWEAQKDSSNTRSGYAMARSTIAVCKSCQQRQQAFESPLAVAQRTVVLADLLALQPVEAAMAAEDDPRILSMSSAQISEVMIQLK